MQSSSFRTPNHFDYQPLDPSIDTIKNNLKYLNIRPKDVSDITKDAQNAYKMVFEQVLLVMRYVRQLMMHEQHSSAATGRMKLLSTIFENQREFDRFDQEELEKIQIGVLKKLEKNAGSNDVIAYLQSLESDVSTYILMKIQKNGVAFAPIEYVSIDSHPRPYAYYDMYTCLQHSLELFKELLSQDIHDEKSVERLIYDRIKYHADIINPMGDKYYAWHRQKNMPKEQQQHIFKLSKEENFAKIIKDYSLVNKDIVLQEIRQDLAMELGEWASGIFSHISNPSYSKLISGKMPWENKVPFNNFFDIFFKENETVISLDFMVLDNLYRINQLDALFDSLKSALKAKLSPNFGNQPWVKEQYLNNKDALSDISAWYERYSTGMLRKIDQIPKAIVSILYHDIKNEYPALTDVIYNAELLKSVYYDSQEKIEEKRASPVRERNLLLTFIISLNLYVRDDENNTHFVNLAERVQCNDIQSIDTDTLNTFTNSIMSSWSIFSKNEDGSLNASFSLDEQDKMTYRFKTIPVFFKKNVNIELRELLWIISSQSSTENPVPFPYNSNFPLPLWIRRPQGFGYRYTRKFLGYNVYTKSFIKNFYSN